ncbi:MAG: RluA family pseudouridine synthase [Myxococcales bacterium]|nr:RluA family pseudouridine synthase [Myxococcales bacterium]
MKPTLVVVVAAGDGDSVRAVLEAVAREARVAMAGRIFLNGRPTSLDEPVELGDCLELYAPRRPETSGAISILAQKDGVVLVDKPAGLACETTRQGEDSVVCELMKRLGGGRVHAATRLDVQVSGVMLCALGRDASRRVQEWRDAGQLERTYIAIAKVRAGLAAAGIWDVPLLRVRDRAGRHKVVAFGAGADPARTRYRILAETARAVLLELMPETGRMHQLRAHAAHAKMPLFGDRLYGGDSSIADSEGRVLPLRRVALHCARVAMPSLSAVSAAPDELLAMWRALGGMDTALVELGYGGQE